MAQELVQFIIIWGIQLLAWSSVGLLIFGELSEYDSIPNTFIMLFSTSFGNWDFTIYDALSKNGSSGIVYFGIIFHIIFILMNGLIFLNLVIAIMSNVINKVSITKDGLFFSKIIQASSSWKNDKHYGFLISAFFPLNVFTICLLPLFMRLGDEKLEQLNKIVQKIMYTPFFIVLLLVFIVCNILLTPFAFCKTLAHKCKLFTKN